jgi:hypothetical protein
MTDAPAAVVSHTAVTPAVAHTATVMSCNGTVIRAAVRLTVLGTNAASNTAAQIAHAVTATSMRPLGARCSVARVRSGINARGCSNQSARTNHKAVTFLRIMTGYHSERRFVHTAEFA